MKKILALILIFMLGFTAFAAEKPQAISRGGTIVVRIPWSWIEALQLGPSWWGSIDQAEGETKEQVLFPILPPGKVAEWMVQGSVDEKRIRIFAISSVDSEALVMNRRPLDDNYYAVVRPEKKFGGSFDLHWSVSEWGLSMSNGVVHGDLKHDMDTEVLRLEVDSMDGIEAAWKKDFGGFGMVLYEAEGVYIAVITEKNAKKDDLGYTQLYIDMGGLYDYSETYVEMEGYMDGKSGVYCCVLSGDEFDRLKNGAKVRLEHDHSKW